MANINIFVCIWPTQKYVTALGAWFNCVINYRVRFGYMCSATELHFSFYLYDLDITKKVKHKNTRQIK